MDNQWMDDAVCRQVGVQEFFPDKGESAKVRIAKEICSACPVVAECLAFGINEPFGIWGGTRLSGARFASCKGKQSHDRRTERRCAPL
jgi:WhiB family redox-sensing transcriptional regulator